MISRKKIQFANQLTGSIYLHIYSTRNFGTQLPEKPEQNLAKNNSTKSCMERENKSVWINSKMKLWNVCTIQYNMIWQTNKRYVLFVCNQQKIYQKSDSSSHCMVEHHALHITGHLDALSSPPISWLVNNTQPSQPITRAHSFLRTAEFRAEPRNMPSAAEFLHFCGIREMSVISTIVGVMDDDISHQSLISVDSSHESRVSLHFWKEKMIFFLCCQHNLRPKCTAMLMASA